MSDIPIPPGAVVQPLPAGVTPATRQPSSPTPTPTFEPPTQTVNPNLPGATVTAGAAAISRAMTPGTRTSEGRWAINQQIILHVLTAVWGWLILAGVVKPDSVIVGVAPALVFQVIAAFVATQYSGDRKDLKSAALGAIAALTQADRGAG